MWLFKPEQFTKTDIVQIPKTNNDFKMLKSKDSAGFIQTDMKWSGVRIFDILNYPTMKYGKITVAIFPSRQSVFPSERLKLSWQSPLLANTRKYCKLTESIRENIG